MPPIHQGQQTWTEDRLHVPAVLWQTASAMSLQIVISFALTISTKCEEVGLSVASKTAHCTNKFSRLTQVVACRCLHLFEEKKPGQFVCF